MVQRRLLLRVAVAVTSLVPALLVGQSIPAERPRSRPPSELTGWADWEKAEDLLKRITIPPAPPLSPEEALKTFRLAPGYRLELVASEPMVQNPIFFEFDPDGRIWVVEYQGYMRDLQGRGEADPICRVVVLEDIDEDGKADQSTVFLDRLVMPRSLAFVEGGVLVAEPPKLWFCQDTNHDLRCDSKVEVGTFGRAGNPQHTANGLRYGLDNWLHSSDWPKRHRFVDGRLIEESTIHRGQFGVTFDDFGRFLTCYESSALHADLLPAEYLLRNPNFLKAYQRSGSDRSQFGVNVNIARQAQEVFPIRVTPQITLGALELRNDGRLRTYTVVAGSCFYNGQQYPDDAYGNVFVPEAGGHLIGRLRISGEIEPKATRFYPAEQEFLASTDERFRPVNSRVGPDGALYIADMYRGIIEHVIFMVPYLEKQIKERALEEGRDMGRIYRVVYEGKPIDRRNPRLSSKTSGELAAHLGFPNGWWRYTAQRLLVERRDAATIPTLEKMALQGTNALERMHALWTLDGVGSLNLKTTLAALGDRDEKVRATAVRLSERFIGESIGGASRVPASSMAPRLRGEWARAQEGAVFAGMARLAGDSSPLVRLQVLLALGGFATGRAEEVMATLLTQNEQALFRAAAMTGLHAREFEFLSRLSANSAWQTRTDHRQRMIALLAQAVIDAGNPPRIEQLLSLLESPLLTASTERRGSTALPSSSLRRADKAARPKQNKGLPAQWFRDAIFEGMLAALPRDFQNINPIALSKEPTILTKLTRSDNEQLRQRAFQLHAFFTWPNARKLRPGLTDMGALDEEQKTSAELGEQQFGVLCAACHQPHGGGLANVAPPLGGSEWINASPERLVRIVLHGLYGPIEVNGQTWNLHMPSFGPVLDDERLAATLTFIRMAWGNAASPVAPALVKKVRHETESRTLPWTAQELDAALSSSTLSSPGVEPSVIRPDANGQLSLPAKLAVTYGRELAYRPSLDILAPWRREQDVAEWRVETDNGGSYQALITLAADDASAGDKFVIETQGSRTQGVVLSSGGYDRFREYACGSLILRAGVSRVLMRPDGPLKRELADVRALRLVPVRLP
ncbi:MAG: c-type cytochrome [Verrucomicrobia bacterium]|nr:c-type cytochrome [Verrucomicrobiota bacterium]